MRHFCEKMRYLNVYALRQVQNAPFWRIFATSGNTGSYKWPRVVTKIPEEKLNVHGGSIAIGHPFAATGARIVGTLAKLLKEKGSGRGLISVCTAGGMGVAAVMEAA